VCIDDAETVDLPMSATEMLTSLVMAGPDLGILMVVAASTQALRAKYPTNWIRALLTLRRGLLLAPQAAEDYDFFGVRAGRSGCPRVEVSYAAREPSIWSRSRSPSRRTTTVRSRAHVSSRPSLSPRLRTEYRWPGTSESYGSWKCPPSIATSKRSIDCRS